MSSFSLNLSTIRNVMSAEMSRVSDKFCNLSSDFSNQIKISKIFQEAIKGLASCPVETSFSNSKIKFVEAMEESKLVAPLFRIFEENIPEVVTLKEGLLDFLNCYNQLFAHLDDLKSGKLIQFIGENWAQSFLVYSLRSSIIEEEASAFFISHREHPQVVTLIKKVSLEQDPDVVMVLGTLCQDKHACQWARDFLIQIVEEEKLGLVFMHVLALLEQQFENHQWIIPTWMDWLKKNKPFAIPMLIRFYGAERQGELHASVTKDLLKGALLGNSHFQVISVVLAAFEPDLNLNTEFIKLRDTHFLHGDLLPRAKIWLQVGGQKN